MPTVIFDMDGVISDTELLHAQTEATVLGSRGINVEAQELLRHAGISSEQVFREYLEQSKIDVDELVQEKYAALLSLANEIRAIPGVSNLIRSFKQQGWKLGVASASRRDFVQLVLSSLRLQDYFDITVTVHEAGRGKPAPDVFLLAAKRLGADPKECIVIEDSRSGVEAARAAGMKCIAFQGFPPSRQDVSKADLVISHFSQIHPQRLATIL